MQELLKEAEVFDSEIVVLSPATRQYQRGAGRERRRNGNSNYVLFQSVQEKNGVRVLSLDNPSLNLEWEDLDMDISCLDCSFSLKVILGTYYNCLSSREDNPPKTTGASTLSTLASHGIKRRPQNIHDEMESQLWELNYWQPHSSSGFWREPESHRSATEWNKG